jgi:hypothetical protein
MLALLGKYQAKNNFKKSLTPGQKRVRYALVARENETSGWPRETAARAALMALG